jgi:hypothetical protein
MTDLDKYASWHNIGTFWVTVIILIISVFPKPFPEPAASNGKRLEKSTNAGDAANMNWWMVGVVALAVVSAGVLNVIAARSRNGSRLPKTPAEARGVASFAIVSAKWGIGGNAHKDVTDIVRSYVKADSVSLPVSKSIFGDPYPGEEKVLTVVYSVARQWEVRHKESDNLVLPEKDGEEQSRKEMEARHTQLAKIQASIQSPGEALLATLTETEYRLFLSTEYQFKTLNYRSQLAARRIHQKASVPVSEFRERWETDGFGDCADVIAELIKKSFIEQRQFAYHISPQMARFIDAIIDRNPFEL